MSNTPNQNEPDNFPLDSLLRPTTWDDYVGQEKIKDSLKLIIKAAEQRKESCDHLLFYGQAGLGKTTLAYIIGKKMNMPTKTTSGPALEKTGDIAAILTNLDSNDILFIDEIHRLGKQVEEVLYPALESRKLHIIVGKGPSARTLSISLPPFTVIGATTKASLLSAPLRSRFGAIFKLDYYKEEDLEKILTRSAKILGVEINKDAGKRLASVSRLTPRVANRLLKRCRDWAQVYKDNVIDLDVVERTLEMFEIDNMGLEEADRDLLATIIKKFDGGPVGIRSLSAAMNEEVGTIEDVYEPFLMRVGLLKRTSAGRIATKKAYQHLGLKESKKSLL